MAKFSRELDPMTVTNDTVKMRDATDTLIPITVSYSASPSVIKIVPVSPLEAGMMYTVTLSGDPSTPRITDTTGVSLPDDFTWTFFTSFVTPTPTTFSLWNDTTLPANPNNPDNQIEIGLKFRSANAGLITGVRFYKGPANTGTHIGHLWNSDGSVQLGEVTFTNETPAGWQTAFFPTPIAIEANTTYVISYFAPEGQYAFDSLYFAPSGPGGNGVDSGPLHALSHVEAGGNPTPGDEPELGVGNGVFTYAVTAGAGGFPSNSFKATNYWVDVVFAAPSDAPQVLLTTPAPGAIDVPTNTALTVTFSESLNSISVNPSTVQLFDTADNLVPVTVSYTPGSFSFTITPTQGLQPGQAYTVVLRGGESLPRIFDTTGTPLAVDYTWSFTTAQSVTP
jgi:hypothetical protein